jgi:hypothetical protein
MPLGLKAIATLRGTGAGYLSFVRLLWDDVRVWWRKPRLKIEFDPAEDLREWTLLGTRRKEKVATVHVRNRGKITASRCIAILKLISSPKGASVREKEFALHWADTDYSARTNTAETVEVGFERRRLDVPFTFVEAENSPGGAWIAIPLALSAPVVATQAFLPPGEYRFLLSVACENGKGSSREFVVSSPQIWTDLSMRATG